MGYGNGVEVCMLSAVWVFHSPRFTAYRHCCVQSSHRPSSMYYRRPCPLSCSSPRHHCWPKDLFHSKWNVGMGPCWRNPLVYSIFSSILRQLTRQTSEDSVTATGSWQHLILLGHCPLRCGICSEFLYQLMVLFLLLQQFMGQKSRGGSGNESPTVPFITRIHCQIFYPRTFRLC